LKTANLWYNQTNNNHENLIVRNPSWYEPATII